MFYIFMTIIFLKCLTTSLRVKRYINKQIRTFEWISIEGVIHKEIMKSKWMKKHTPRKSKKEKVHKIIKRRI